MFGLPNDMLLVVALDLLLLIYFSWLTVPLQTTLSPKLEANKTLRKVDTSIFSSNELLCDAPLGLSTGFIGDSQLSASSSYDSNHDIRNIRLTTTQRPVAA